MGRASLARFRAGLSFFASMKKPEKPSIYSILVFQLFLHGKVINGETLNSSHS